MNERISRYINEYLKEENNLRNLSDRLDRLELDLWKSNTSFAWHINSVNLKQLQIFGNLAFGLINLEDKTGVLRKLAELNNTIVTILVENKYERNANSLKYIPGFATLAQNLKKYSKENISNDAVHNNNFEGRILIDVTHVMGTELATGIQRVVKEISGQILCQNIIPICIYGPYAFSYNLSSDKICKVKFQQNDILLFMDVSWDSVDACVDLMKINSGNGGKNIICLYDLIPIRYPEFCRPVLNYNFNRWVKEGVMKCDKVICISEHVVNDFKDYWSEFHESGSIMPEISFFHLGSDFNATSSVCSYDNSNKFTKLDGIYYIAVGSIEPRKAYSLALDAFEIAWSKDDNISFVIVGRSGWQQQALQERIINHREYGKKLFWFNDLSDEELSFLYRGARALVYPSIIEGFGLPLIEAAHYGLPAIVSDIPVFREIAGDNAIYFDVADYQMLASILISEARIKKQAPIIDYLSWKESAQKLLELLK